MRVLLPGFRAPEEAKALSSTGHVCLAFQPVGLWVQFLIFGQPFSPASPLGGSNASQSPKRVLFAHAAVSGITEPAPGHYRARLGN